MTGPDWIASPLTLLRQWQDRDDKAPLEEFLLLGYTVDLPFLETVATPAARALGARITVVGDAGQGIYEAVDVRHAGRTYLHGLASCRSGAFHPKLALLCGEHELVAAIGSGNPTSAGWGYNDEIWTVLRGGTDGAPTGLSQVGAWLRRLPDHVALPGYIADVLRQSAARLMALPCAEREPSGVVVLDNLERSLLSQLPSGPVDELCLTAPFIDASGRALRTIIDRFDPARIVIGVQRRLGSSTETPSHLRSKAATQSCASSIIGYLGTANCWNGALASSATHSPAARI